MTRRLFLLNGLAILAVVCNHAVSWGFTAMFWWTHRYRPVSVPNYDQLGSFTYYALLVVKQLTIFSVPAFLFVSGFFISYAARGSQTGLNWKTIKTRLLYLLIPYLIWSGIIFIEEAIEGTSYPPMGYFMRLLTGNAIPPYFYIPVIFQLYLISPFLTSLARNKWKLFIFSTGFFQLSIIGFLYAAIFFQWKEVPSWFFGRWIFFFSIGIVAGLYLDQFKTWLEKIKPYLLVSVIIFGLLSIIEPEAIYRMTGLDWRGGPATIPTNLYALCFVLCFLAFDKIKLPFPKSLAQLSNKTYGIYLIHRIVLRLFAKIIYHIAPMVLASQILFQPLLIVAGLGVPLIIFSVFLKTPARNYYRYLFG